MPSLAHGCLPCQGSRSAIGQCTLSAKVGKSDALKGAQDGAILTFRGIRGFNPVEENNFGAECSEDSINRAAENTNTSCVAAWVASIVATELLNLAVVMPSIKIGVQPLSRKL